MVNIFSFDMDKNDFDEVHDMLNAIQNVLPEGDIVIAIPKHCNLWMDVPIEMLYYYRQMFDNIIEERQRRNADKDAL